MLNPKWLSTFSTLAQTGSFTQTAQQLFMTQPGVSQHIKKLEDEIGEELIFRQGKQFELTQKGILLLEFISEQRQRQDEFLARMKEDNPSQGQIRIACSGAMAMKLYSNLLEIQRNQPDLIINLEAAPTSRIQYLLDENQIDLGISTQKLEHPSITTEKLGKEYLSLIIPKEFESNITDFSSLAKLGYINHPDGKHYADLVLGKNFKEDYKGIESLPIRGYVNQLAQILLPVSQGIGFSVLPHSVLLHFNDNNLLADYPLPYKVTQPLYLAQKKHRKLPIRYNQIIELIKSLTSKD